MPQCVNCTTWFPYPQNSSAKEEEYCYCSKCRNIPTYVKEYVGGECGFDGILFNESEIKTEG